MPFCPDCGNEVNPGSRFCGECGTAIPQPSVVEMEPIAPVESAVERVIGQVPVEYQWEGAGIFGRTKRLQGNLLITRRRVVFIRETSELNDLAVYESERLDGVFLSSALLPEQLMEGYDWMAGPWAVFAETEPDTLLSSDPDNFEVPLENISRAEITLTDPDDPEKLELIPYSGDSLKFLLMLYSGNAAVRFFTQALGAGRVLKQRE